MLTKKLSTHPLAIFFGLVFALIFVHEVLWPHPLYRTFLVAPPVNLSTWTTTPAGDFSGITPALIGIWALNYLLTGLLGFCLLNGLPSTRREPVLLRVAAGFFLGFIALCGISRFWSAFTGGRLFYFLSVSTILLSVAWLRFKTPAPPTLRQPWIRWWTTAALLFAALLLGVLSMVQLIYFSDFRWVGHGLSQYAFMMPDFERGAGLFPILDLHYDEFIYHHFLSAPLGEMSFDPLIPWWVTLGLNKASFFAFLILAARGAGLRTGPAVALTVFLFFGTLAIAPLSYDLLSDSASPLFFVAHSGRLLGVAVFLYWLACVREGARPRTLAQVLLAAGLTATSISNSLWLVTLLILLSLFPRQLFNRAKARAQSFTSLVLCPLLFLVPGAVFLIWVKLALLAAHFARSPWWRVGKPVRAWGPAFAATALFCLLFGNIFSHNPLNHFYLQASGNATAEVAPTVLKSMQGSLIGDHREVEDYFYYSHSVYAFSAVFAVFFALTSLALKTKALELDAEGIVYYALVFSLPFIFFFIQYVGAGNRAWIRTRFLEVPVYTILFLALVYLFTSWSAPRARLLQFFLFIYALGPFLATGRFQQIWLNLRLLRSLF